MTEDAATALSIIDEETGEIIEIEDTVNVNEDMSITTFGDVVASVISEAQFEVLSGRVEKKYIKTRPGKGKRTFSYVPHGYVTAALNRAFGFSWDWELVPVNGAGDLWVFLDPITERKRPGSALVHGKLTVRVHDPKDPSVVLATIVKTSTGEKEFVPGMTYGGLVKSAESDALKKAASRLGVALMLYWEEWDERDEREEDVAVSPAVEKRVAVEARVKQLAAEGTKMKEIPAVILEEHGVKITMAEIGGIL